MSRIIVTVRWSVKTINPMNLLYDKSLLSWYFCCHVIHDICFITIDIDVHCCCNLHANHACARLTCGIVRATCYVWVVNVSSWKSNATQRTLTLNLHLNSRLQNAKEWWWESARIHPFKQNLAELLHVSWIHRKSISKASMIGMSCQHRIKDRGSDQD